jgi:hypothetical protein
MSRVSSVVALGALTALCIAPARAQEGGAIAEPSSGVMFPFALTAPGTGTTHQLMGTGIRTKTFLQVKVYAFGLYVDPDGARGALGAWAGKTARDLERDPTFYDALLRREFGQTLRLVMTRDVGGDDMAEAFDGALRPRVQRAAAEMSMPEGETALDTFRGYFSVEEMTKTSELLFYCSPQGTLIASVKGQLQPAIESPALCWALFDVYLGAKPISGDGKKKVIAGFPGLLNEGAPGG